MRWSTTLLCCIACSPATGVDGGSPDAATTLDGGRDAGRDAGSHTPEWHLCQTTLQDGGWCLAAQQLSAGTVLIGEDTAVGGGLGDCAASPSGFGGPSRYYRITIPTGASVKLRASPDSGMVDGLVRLFSDCDAEMVQHSSRGGSTTLGEASLCFHPEAAERRYVLAVSRYSGEPDLNIRYDLSFQTRDASEGCD